LSAFRQYADIIHLHDFPRLSRAAPAKGMSQRPITALRRLSSNRGADVSATLSSVCLTGSSNLSFGSGRS
ncbi:hypothetical protein KCU90_g66, partial [Aureobasidium melanogenum]